MPTELKRSLYFRILKNAPYGQIKGMMKRH